MIFAIKPFEIHDGDGIRTTVFFKGCPLRCKWCHNPESFCSEKDIFFDNSACVNCMKCTELCNANEIKDGKHVFLREKCIHCGMCENICVNNAFEVSGNNLSAEQIAQEVLKDEIFMKGSGGGVTFSGGEPLMQIDLCIEIAKILKKHDINIAIDTCGFVSRDSIERIIPYADTFLFDIKAIDEETHISCTGVSNKIILENIEYVDSLGIPVEIRYPYIPTINDHETEKVAGFVKKLKSVKTVKILPYHNYAENKYESLDLEYSLSGILPPTEEEILNVAQKMQSISMKNVVTN